MGVSMADIARIANVSKPTVSRVLSGSPLVTEATREHVLKVARDNGYAVNRNAQKLRQTRTDTVAVVLDFGSYRGGRVADPFIFELLAGVSEALSVRNLDLLLSPPVSQDARGYQDQINARMVDGFIFLGQGERDPMLRKLARAGVPFVVWGAVDPDEPYCAVGSDNFLGGKLAGNYFLKCGRRRWLYIGNDSHIEQRMRHDGLAAAASEAGSEVSIEALSVSDMSYAATYRAVKDYIAEHAAPDAIFCFSDTAAMATISELREAGLASPRDFALVGYNNIPPAADFTPAITTIEQETHLAGAILVEKLMQLIEGGRANSTVLPTRIIVRET
ncbi:MAG: LacI family DNA-binding transcriptional regulator [Sphingomonadales bacterium]|nr:LacI family DNA-binding transcriptional regulator [Sphingomonadales bacterium]MDE2568697.1 LacI family DNA-binding transcriptional regulator [Sphingomonadales bacterium]